MTDNSSNETVSRRYVILTVEANRNLMEVLYIEPDGVSHRQMVWIPEDPSQLDAYIASAWPHDIMTNIRSATKRVPHIEKHIGTVREVSLVPPLSPTKES